MSYLRAPRETLKEMQVQSWYVDSPLRKWVLLMATREGILVVMLTGLLLQCSAGASEPTGLNAFEPHFRQSVLRGWRTFQTGHADDGVACVHCHPDYKTIRRWARAYPKVEVFDGTPYQVKTLRRVILEALDKHSDINPESRLNLVDDLVAYIAWWGDGMNVSPGHSRNLPPASADLKLLRKSVMRGMRFIHNRSKGSCWQCHKSESEPAEPVLKDAATRFPMFVASAKKVMSLPVFVAYHLDELGMGRFHPENETVTDITAALAHLAEGRRYHPGHLQR